MSTKPQKRTGFQQGVFAQSSTMKEEVGTLRVLRDGRKFRYAKAGASALGAGKLAVAAAVAADVMNEACTAVHAIGDTIFAETITSATYVENYFAGGYLQINDGTGEGHQYKINSSTAVTAGTAIILQLDEPIRVATAGTSASEFSIVHSPWRATVESATLGLPVGITPMAVTAAYYYWAQTGGPALALSGNSDAVGKPLYQSTSTAGALSGADSASYYPEVAIALGTVGVATEYKPVFLTLD
jgi:hypothetical protein